MNNKIKNIIVTVLFSLMIGGFMLANMIAPDKTLSTSERRELESLPEFNLKTVLGIDEDTKFFTDFEDYALDQFVLRDTFRSIKAYSKFYLFRQLDNNDIFIVDDGIYSMDKVTSLNEISVRSAARLYEMLGERLFANSNLYYTIVPDKNYFVSEKNGFLHLDYDKLYELMHENVGEELEYIDVMGLLGVEDYYKTDLHWDQAEIVDIANKLLTEMGGAGVSKDDFTVNEIGPFYGTYYGQSALKFTPDTIKYLTSAVLDGCTVKYLENGKLTVGKLYDLNDFNNLDSYDLFLGGVQPLIKIENPSNTSGKQLFVVRDSFGSSLSPLLVSDYSEVIIIDLRYLNQAMVGNVLNQCGIRVRPNSDVLFMYHTGLLNSSSAFAPQTAN